MGALEVRRVLLRGHAAPHEARAAEFLSSCPVLDADVSPASQAREISSARHQYQLAVGNAGGRTEVSWERFRARAGQWEDGREASSRWDACHGRWHGGTRSPDLAVAAVQGRSASNVGFGSGRLLDVGQLGGEQFDSAAFDFEGECSLAEPPCGSE